MKICLVVVEVRDSFARFPDKTERQTDAAHFNVPLQTLSRQGTKSRLVKYKLTNGNCNNWKKLYILDVILHYDLGLGQDNECLFFPISWKGRALPFLGRPPSDRWALIYCQGVSCWLTNCCWSELKKIPSQFIRKETDFLKCVLLLNNFEIIFIC